MWAQTYLKPLHSLRKTLFVVCSHISKLNPDDIKNLLTQQHTHKKITLQQANSGTQTSCMVSFLTSEGALYSSKSFKRTKRYHLLRSIRTN
jgi:hypothetical protein